MRMEDVLGNDYRRELIEASEAADGRFCAGKNGVEAIYTPADQKVDFIVYANHVDCHVRSSLGYLRCTRCGGLAAIFPPGRC